MLSKVFFDTNIVLDILDKQRKNNSLMEELIFYVVKNNIKVVVSEDMLSTIYYIFKDKKAVLDFFKTVKSKWIISSFGDDVISQAIELSSIGADFEDALQCLCAKKNGCKAILTSDKNFVDCEVPKYSVVKFLEMIKETK